MLVLELFWLFVQAIAVDEGSPTHVIYIKGPSGQDRRIKRATFTDIFLPQMHQLHPKKIKPPAFYQITYRPSLITHCRERKFDRTPGWQPEDI
jgi:hypothetical protein